MNKSFLNLQIITELKRLYPRDQTWDQLVNLAGKLEANLDGDSDEVRQAFAASTVTASGSTAAATTVATVATNTAYIVLLHTW